MARYSGASQGIVVKGSAGQQREDALEPAERNDLNRKQRQALARRMAKEAGGTVDAPVTAAAESSGQGDAIVVSDTAPVSPLATAAVTTFSDNYGDARCGEGEEGGRWAGREGRWFQQHA